MAMGVLVIPNGKVILQINSHLAMALFQKN